MLRALKVLILLLLTGYWLSSWPLFAKDDAKTSDAHADKDDGKSKDKDSSKGKDGGSTGEGLINSLLAPGPLMEGHKNLEHADCLKCHDAGKGVPDQKCLDCHTAIRKSVQEKATFHGMTKLPCIGCHTDHKGRTFNSTVVNQHSFDHAKTGFTLHGAHAKIACLKCHTEKRTDKPIRQDGTRFFGKTETCLGCHKKDDVHFFPQAFMSKINETSGTNALTKDCGVCHSDKTWKDAKFDHKKETGYALVGDHAKIKCAECHAPHGKDSAKYKFPELKQEACLTCHKDFHAGKFDAKFAGGHCDRCHNQDSWKVGKFNHDITGFMLKGAHAKQNCIACHKQEGANPPLKSFKFSGLNTTCDSCHKDYHGFHGEKSPRLGALAQCQTCHNETAWHPPMSFDHNTQTGFPITGKHIGLKCFVCHLPTQGPKSQGSGVPRKYAFPGLETKTCELCHKSPHDANSNPVFRTTKCSTCHTTEGWTIFNKMGSGTFNHNTMTRFPLTGSHTPLKCDTCHKIHGKDVFKFPGVKTGFCETCHATPHKGQFEPNFLSRPCTSCHNTVAFKQLLAFNHDQTAFRLTDAHALIAQDCIKCHIPTKKILPVKPPRPAGKFIFTHPKTGFCIDCHANPHKDQFDSHFASDNCAACHNLKSFKDLRNFNHDQTRFHITGAHLNLKNDCVKCHVKTDKILPVKPPRPAGKFQFEHSDTGFCESCHKSVHDGQFDGKFASEPCRQCHTVDDFTHRRPFNHDETEFKIDGAHKKLADDCGQCHKPTNKMLPVTPPKPADQFLFSDGKNGFCRACHQNEHKTQFHPNFSGEACLTCHSTVHFSLPVRFDHNESHYKLKGKHLKVKCLECHKPTEARFHEPPQDHKGQFLFAGLATKDCALCHNDPHKGRFGKTCSQCHTEAGWDKTANFHKEFILTGVHYLLECNDCHVAKRQLTGIGNDCKMCHAKDDIHQGTQPDCASCHTQQFWSTTRFQHALTDFPLRGAHRLVDCSECHGGGVYEGKSSECVSCHLQDSLQVTFPNHKLPGFQQCEICHNQFKF